MWIESIDKRIISKCVSNEIEEEFTRFIYTGPVIVRLS